VSIYDENNNFSFNLKNDILRLQKYPKYRDNPNMMGHGFGFMNMMYEEKGEIFYEGNIIPDEAKKEDYLELLKEDIINNGIISTTIKNYILNNTHKKRIEEIDQAKNDISMKRYVQSLLPDLIKNKVVLKTNNEIYEIIHNYERQKSMEFVKETPKRIKGRKIIPKVVNSSGQELLSTGLI
jgi:hypothetical protein